MSEIGCLKDVKAKYVETTNVLVQGDSSKLGAITFKASDSSSVHVYVNKKDRLSQNLIVSTDPPEANGTIEDKIVEWSYLNSMSPYYVPTHLDATGGAAFSQQADADELNEGYAATSTLMLMLSNLRNTYPLELYNGLAGTTASDIAR